MAAVTRIKARPVTPAGYEVNETGTLMEAVTAGDLLILTSGGWRKATTTTVNAHGIALQDGFAGQANFPIGIQGEMDGFSGLTPGAPLYPSSTVAGGLDTVAPIFYSATTTPSVAVPAQANVRAASATRIRFSFV